MKFPTWLAVLCAAIALRADPEYPKMGPDIYDTHADGSTLVADAIAQAGVTHKRIILDLGANWYSWCRKLKDVFDTDADVKKALEENFLVVLIDVNHNDNKSRNDVLNRYYDDPISEGLPVLVVLEKDGRKLAVQPSGGLENHQGTGYDEKKILAFLAKWTAAKK